jgi:D-aminopeptidase
VAVKEGIGTTAAASVHPATARELIRAGVARAIRNRANIAAARNEGAILLQLELLRSSQADLAMKIPGVERQSPRFIRYRARDIAAAYKMVDLITLITSLDRL